MRAVVIYESMFGNTRLVAHAIGDGLRGQADVAVVAVGDVEPVMLTGADLLVVGAPTHMHGMSRPRSRAIAVAVAKKPSRELPLEPGATGAGVREWLGSAPRIAARAAAFDTRGSGLAVMTGRASKQIQRRLRHRGARMVAPCHSFIVGSDNAMAAGELDRARAWGEQLAHMVSDAA